jgi:two-component system phosphate regulon sensor histidine kinase PhoR
LLIQDLSEVRHLQIVRRDFISNISHELRTPLASMKALVETLLDGAIEDPDMAIRFLSRANVEVDAMAQMVEELQELARIESGQVPLQLQSVTVSDLILPAFERMQTQAEGGQLGMVVNLPAKLPPVLADPARISQVLTNLISNAIKYTQPGGQISVRAKPHQNMVLIEVEDTGAGIPAKDLPRIFERFYKADRARTSGGTGLGLAIARHLVKVHGGEIWVKSKEKKGSTFYFTLPLAGVSSLENF